MSEKATYAQLEEQVAALMRKIEEIEADRDNLLRQKEADETRIAGRIAEAGALHYQIEFQQMITRLLSKFVEPGTDTAATIDESLGAIGTFTGMDRAYVFQICADGWHVDNTHEWCAEGITPQIRKLQAVDLEKELPWFWKRIATDEIFNVPNVSELPSEAAIEKAHFEAQGIQSLLVVPMRSKKKITGFIGFDSVRTVRTWPDEIVYLLRVAGQIIGNSLAAENAQIDLKASEVRYRTLTANLNVGVYRTTVGAAGRFIEANPAVVRMFGFDSRSELLQISAADLYQNARDRETFSAKMLERGEVKNEEFLYRRRDGTLFTGSESCVAVTDDDGNVTFFDGIIEDITERRETQEALRTSHELHSKLIETIPDVVIRTDLDGRILYCNEVVLNMGGYRRDEVEGKNILDFIAPRDHERAIENTLRMLDGHQGPKEYHLVTKDGDEAPFEVNGDVLRHGDGAPFGTVVVCRNLTERNRLAKEREQLEERLRHAGKMEAIGTLAGGIAHEFNNILGIILGNTELAMDDMPDWSPGKYNLQEVRSASLRARDIVRQLLSFSRKTEGQSKPVDMVSIVKDTLGFLRSYILSPVEIRFGLSVDLAYILGEPSQINQVLINLCTNAADAMEENGGILAIRLDQVEVDALAAAENPGMHAGPHVQLTVSDTGHGMEPDFIEKIFDPYFTTKPVGKGTGMGLAVVHGVVTAYGGAILVESEPGRGTLVKVLFPLIEAESVRTEPMTEELPVGKETVLFVDDEEAIAAVGRQILERLGYRVETKTCPVEALDLIRTAPQRFDLVITDMAMPRMSGDRLVKEILKIRSDMPIIICTGHSEKVDERSALAIGARMYIGKPVDKADLAQKIRQVLGD